MKKEGLFKGHRANLVNAESVSSFDFLHYFKQVFQVM